MHTACVCPPPHSQEGFGRQVVGKLPFAGYSVVKELQSSQLSAFSSNFSARLRPFGLRRGKLTTRVATPANFILACLAEARINAVPQRAKAGGEYRARTGDLLVANQALSQLS